MGVLPLQGRRMFGWPSSQGVALGLEFGHFALDSERIGL